MKRENIENDFPFKTKEFYEWWSKFREYRSEIGYALTDTAQNLLFKKFKEFSEIEVLKAIEKSIICGWKGVFPIREASYYYIDKDENSPKFLN